MTSEKLIRVLVVDDSAYIRKVMKQMLERSPFIEVVGTAINGVEALEKVKELDPDVITLDLIMPVMNGVEFLKNLMPTNPKPVLIASIASENGRMTMDAIEAGALEYIQKPTALATEKIYEITNELIEKVKILAQTRIPKPETAVAEIHNRRLKSNNRFEIVVIGVSTGGPQALRKIIPLLPTDFPLPICIVQHMPEGYTAIFSNRLNEQSKVKVVEATEGMTVEPGKVIIAKAGKHLAITPLQNGKKIAKLMAGNASNLYCPAVDVLFRSAAEVYGEKVLGLVLTGMGNDGKEGAAWIKAKGGIVLTEAESTCVVYGMPRSVDEAMLSDERIPLEEIAKRIVELTCTVL
ncbi:protein-glutamate methylesterase/protein-glutamine glutaminase [Tenuifilum thalassicum]|uniref:Protein-glutamate methylesterase/protein-glutamine glutaminase n=1 Tax=Tenuifilum thalassicum TaxID=2590900 RepID=A0A7D3XV81_9BACT|nr:chemotaxis response regulator protein-glutamate methylesterase [Tenuifilum thalassicum]QKG79951.1 chemotaxis response regulator protein-glutamate methylesterase [Tenuifilum thalassicum]